ncbi:MAG: CehA/McbA family metallohydrolase [Vicinamibacterales bacterium]
MKRVALTAALVAAVAVWGLSLPPRRTMLSPGAGDGAVRGLLHVHSRASDGRGTLDDIAAAAARAGLRFVVVTDHGDGTRLPEDPAYRSGVLIIDAVEISTRGGHYVALGLRKTPYPLGGEPADVVDDVRRLGGMGIAAHPDSPKAELRWRDWQAPLDGVELINPDTSWRVHAFTDDGSRWLLLRTLLGYAVRPSEAVAGVLTESNQLRAQWLALTADRPVVAIAGADAHAKLALRDAEPGDNRFSIPIPSYDSSFESLSVHVTPGRPLTGDAAGDSAAVLDGIRRGHVYVAVDGWASPPSFSFTATSGAAQAAAGDTLLVSGPVAMHVRSNAPAGYVTMLRRGADVVTERGEPSFDIDVGSTPGTYTVEVRRPMSEGMPPWLTSNPIYVRAVPWPARREEPAASAADGGQPLFDGRTTAGWSYEADPSSVAAVDVAPFVDGSRVRLRYGLAGGSLAGQYSAAAVDVPAGAGDFDGVAFSARADAPMRISVQVRAEVKGAPPERWERSVYVDATEALRFVRFADMVPVGRTHEARPPRRDVRAVMFVVDTTNTKPGASGHLWIGRPRLANGARP